jgi:hypothetical protein
LNLAGQPVTIRLDEKQPAFTAERTKPERISGLVTPRALTMVRILEIESKEQVQCVFSIGFPAKL